MDKNQLILGIHTLVSNNVIGPKQLDSRYKGFKGELYFELFFSNKYPAYKMLDGGIIISKNSNESSLDNSVYFTITSKADCMDDYRIIYENLSKLSFEKMFIVFYADDKWEQLPVLKYPQETISLGVPRMFIKEFDLKKNDFVDTNQSFEIISNIFTNNPTRGRNRYKIDSSYHQWLNQNLMKFDREQLLHTYMNRLFLDGFIGFSKVKGKASDIDFILKKNDNKFILLEVKEKDLPKGGKMGFGLDVPRLRDLMRLQTNSDFSYILVIRQVNNQTERNLVAWKFIPINLFHDDVKNQNAIAGSNGMRAEGTENPTLICSLNLFKDL